MYEDNCYVAFDKPSGLLVVPTPKNEKHTLIHIVNKELLESGAPKTEKLYPCHRLDRETSGVILFAKGKRNQELMMDEFRKRSIKKVYIAFVSGRLKYKAGEMKSAISDFDQERYSRHPQKKLAITRYRTLEVKRDYSIAEVYPITGRTNQIRIQFSQAGYPILGDRKYAFGRDFSVKFRRTALHACQLQWFHPVYRKIVTVKSPLAKDMEEFIEKN